MASCGRESNGKDEFRSAYVEVLGMGFFGGFASPCKARGRELLGLFLIFSACPFYYPSFF